MKNGKYIVDERNGLVYGIDRDYYIIAGENESSARPIRCMGRNASGLSAKPSPIAVL